MSQPYSVPRRGKRPRRLALAAVALLPLAFVGLVVGAFSNVTNSIDNIPAAIVNEDSLVTTTGDDGEEQMVFAGRQLVTELTGPDSVGFDWTITNAEDAEEALAAGEVYAILTVPEGFSQSILSIRSEQPQRSTISVRTDDAHSYLTGSVMQAVGGSMVDAFGTTITEQYIDGVYASVGDLGTALAAAAGGATEIGAGVRQIGEGATQLQSGAGQLAEGAARAASGVGSYAAGVSALSSGLNSLSSGATGLSQISTRVGEYSAAVGQVSGSLAQLNAGLQANPAISEPEKQALRDVVAGLGAVAGAGPALSAGTSDAISAVQGGIRQSASAAARLAAGGPALSAGVGRIAPGATDVARGAGELASGADALASAAETLADGLNEGAARVPTQNGDTASDVAAVVADPVTLAVSTDNAVTEIAQVIATVLVPLGLWIGALAVFLVLRPFTRRALVSTAVTGRLVVAALAKASLVTAAQALLLVLLLHTAGGLQWQLLPATLLFSLLMALAFTAFHYLLTVALGRAGLVVSLFALAVQIASTGGLYPIEMLSAPFQAISPFLPLTHGVAGMQAIIAGGSIGRVLGASAVLAVFGLVSALLAYAAVRRSRSATALGLAAAVRPTAP